MSGSDIKYSSQDFSSLYELLSGSESEGVGVEKLSSTIEKIGIYYFDDFDRYQHAEVGSAGANFALSILADFYHTTWTMTEEDLSDHLGKYPDNYLNRPDLYRYGWHGKIPDFSTYYQEWLDNAGVDNPPVQAKEPRADATVYCLVADMLEKKLKGSEYMDFLLDRYEGTQAARKEIEKVLKLFGPVPTDPSIQKILAGAKRAGSSNISKDKNNIQ
jgi:hypothetical protein